MSDPTETLRAALSERYTLGPEIGAGSMGTVYLAEDLKHNRTVAIKALRAEFASSVEAERFLREVQIAAGLTHPHIVPLHDSGEADGILYYVMPYVDGASLKELLKTKGALGTQRALEIARDIADGLAYAHGCGFVHRDIKPANVMIAGRHGLIVDFGVARAAEAAASQSLTMSGVVIGTPLYMSPEQFAGSGEADARSDIYSLGCVLYEMLAGAAPFQGRTTVAVLAGHIQGDVPSLAEARPGVPAAVVSIVTRMLAKEPDQRFQTAGELVDELNGAITGTWSGQRVSRPLGRPRPARVGAALAFVTAAVVLAVILGRPVQPDTESLDDNALVALPFHDAVSTPEERALLVELADELTRQLNRWDSLRAIPSVSLTGAMFDLGIDGPTLDRPDDGFRVAAEMGAGRLVMLSLRVRGDSAALSATIHDVASRLSVGAPIESVGSAGDPHVLVARVVHEMLGLEGSVAEVEELRRQSSSPTAVSAYRDGVRSLEAGRLGAAEEDFRTSIRQDPRFAMARHRLGITLYWRGVQDASAQAALAPEIASSALEAVRGSSDLGTPDSLHTVAFYRFQQGDYEAARRIYGELLEHDPMDPYAWLLLGAVESSDLWLEKASLGGLRPRGSLNRAMDAFSEALRLSPGFHLGYGQVFDIARLVLETAEDGDGRGYKPPSDELRAPWEFETPGEMIAFYPVYDDSVLLLDEATFRARDRADIRRGSNRLVDRSLAMVRRWSAFAPTEPRPLEELVAWTLEQRRELGGTTRREEADALAALALNNTQAALALKRDTVPSDLVRLAGLYLGVGEVEAASRAVDRALTVRGDESARRVGTGAVNVRVSRGDVRGALALIALQVPREWFFASEDGLFGDRGAEPIIGRIEVLGATGVGGPTLAREFDQLDALWSQYTPEQIRTLRGHFAPRLATALVLESPVREGWTLALEDSLWWSVSADGSTATPERILAALYPTERDRGATRAYLLGRGAQWSDEHLTATRLFARLDSLVFDIDRRSGGWGLRPLSLYLRAESQEALGNVERAREHYRAFLEAWSVEDPLTAERRQAAIDALARLGAGG